MQTASEEVISPSREELIFNNFKDALQKAKVDPGLIVTRSSIEGKWAVKRRS